MSVLYLECGSGISGDMTVAALLDLGADRAVLEKALASLQLDGFSVEIGRVKKAGLDACDFSVRLDAAHENHDHDMAYLYGTEPHAHGHGHAHPHEGGPAHEHAHAPEAHLHGHGHAHVHEHAHAHEHRHDLHAHRGLPEILDVIERADLTQRAKALAARIFTILAQAEAKAHGVGLEAVHFHEVGAVDSIVDIVAAAVCLDNLGVTEAVAPRLCEGRGFVRCQHGRIPVPVPAVVEIAAAHGLCLEPIDAEGEFVTPTGAAIVAAIKTRDALPKRFAIRKVGMGAGKRDYGERPNLLRAMLLEEQDAAQRGAQEDTICKLESNLDDCSGEALGFVLERLFKAGAKDVHYTPVFMKKNRPGYQLNVICDEADRAALEAIIFAETTTIGIRRAYMERSVLAREIRRVETPLGEARVKVCASAAGKAVYPEYDSVATLAGRGGIPFQQAYRMAREAGEANLREE